MYLQKSGATTLWMKFCLKTAKKQLLFQKLWSLCSIHAIILWTECSSNKKLKLGIFLDSTYPTLNFWKEV